MKDFYVIILYKLYDKDKFKYLKKKDDNKYLIV